MKVSTKYSTHPRPIEIIKTIALVILVSLLFVCFMNAQVTEDTIQVGVGWNMIGSSSTGIPSEILRSEPPEIIVSSFFKYNPGGGYEAKDTLEKGKGYWVKANSDGMIIFYDSSGSSCPGIPAVSYAGKVYNTVLIGNQCWLRENLDVGNMIDSAQNQLNNSMIEKYCYRNVPEFCIIFGGLYQWNEAMQYTTVVGAKGICPDGWHIPGYSEFNTLKITVADDGNALKAIGQGAGGGAGTNTSGFSGLLGGFRYNHGSFDHLLNYAPFWSSTEDDATYAYYMSLGYYVSDFGMAYYYKNSGFSVRCLKD